MKAINHEVDGHGRPARFLSAPPHRVVVVRALPGLGDFLCAVPALRTLRQMLPAACIDLVGLSATRSLVERFSRYVDRLISFPGFPGIIEQPEPVEALPAFLTRMHRQPYDLALQMHGDGSVSNIFTLLLGARRTAGFYLPANHCPDRATFLPYPQHLHEIRRNLALIQFLGAKGSDETLEFPLTAADQDEFQQLVQEHGLQPGRYVCIHAGAKDAARRWSPDSFASAIRMMRSKGLQIVLTGTSGDQQANNALLRRLQEPPVDLGGQTSLGALALLLQNARLLLCNDTGVSHLAAATQTPSVVIFMTSEPQRWAPLNAARHIAVGSGAGDEVPPGDVLAALQTLLNRADRPSALANEARTIVH